MADDEESNEELLKRFGDASANLKDGEKALHYNGLLPNRGPPIGQSVRSGNTIYHYRGLLPNRGAPIGCSVVSGGKVIHYNGLLPNRGAPKGQSNLESEVESSGGGFGGFGIGIGAPPISGLGVFIFLLAGFCWFCDDVLDPIYQRIRLNIQRAEAYKHSSIKSITFGEKEFSINDYPDIFNRMDKDSNGVAERWEFNKLNKKINSKLRKWQKKGGTLEEFVLYCDFNKGKLKKQLASARQNQNKYLDSFSLEHCEYDEFRNIDSRVLARIPKNQDIHNYSRANNPELYRRIDVNGDNKISQYEIDLGVKKQSRLMKEEKETARQKELSRIAQINHEKYMNEEITALNIGVRGKNYVIEQKDYPALFEILDLNKDGRVLRKESEKIIPLLKRDIQINIANFYEVDSIVSTFMLPFDMQPKEKEVTSVFFRVGDKYPRRVRKIECKKHDYSDLFDKIDLNRDGKVTYGELAKCISSIEQYAGKRGYNYQRKEFFRDYFPPKHLYTKK